MINDVKYVTLPDTTSSFSIMSRHQTWHVALLKKQIACHSWRHDMNTFKLNTHVAPKNTTCENIMSCLEYEYF